MALLPRVFAPRAAFLWVAAFTLAACGPARTSIHSLKAVDAPYELESDTDLKELRARFDALPASSPRRKAERTTLASEYHRRVDENLKARRYGAAFDNFSKLFTLWDRAELSRAPELRTFAKTTRELHRHFARSGRDVEAATTLAALALMDPARAADYEARIEEIFQYGDELSVSVGGPAAQRARPIKILESVVTIVPSDKMVDRLVTLYRERQKAIHSAFRRNGADIGLLRIHGEGALRTTHNIVSVLARAGRLQEAYDKVNDLEGIGDDSALRKALKKALTGEDPQSWATLARAFMEASDAQAALAIALEGARRYPQSPEPHFAAGDAAMELENAPLAISYYERGLRLDHKRFEASQTLARLYEFQVSSLAFGDRPNAARKQLAKFEDFYHSAKSALGKPIQPDLANAYAAMARGLVSLGELELAESYLTRSLDIRPTVEALEYRALIALRKDRPAEARANLARAFTLPQDSPSDLFDRIKLMRLLGEAQLAENHKQQANATFRSATAKWLKLLEDYEFSGPYLAEARMELGKLLFLLGRRDQAEDAFFSATEANPAGETTYAEIVSFLVNQGSYDHARDIFLGALGNENVGDYFKTYMSLWLVAEARLQEIDPDQHALEFLRSRRGHLWHDKLARYLMEQSAGGDEVRRAATTRGRRAELLFYGAALGPESRDPERAREMFQEVVESNMVLFFEYEMAKRRLTR
jgi:tetratricopeptide (TPR) repeat protein